MSPMGLSLGGGLSLADRPPTPGIVGLASPGFYAPLGGVSSFARADASTCATQQSQAGAIATVLANVLRDNHWVGGFRTILLETTKKNLIVNPSKPDLWVPGVNAVTVVDNTTDLNDPSGGSTASRLTISAQFGNVGGTAVFTGNGVKAFSIALSPGSAAVTYVSAQDATIPSTLARVSVTWNGTSAPTVAAIIGAPTVMTPVKLANGFWLIAFTIAVTAADTNEIVIAPAGGGTTGSVYEWQAQCEDGAFPTSPIIQGASALTRATDALTLTGITAPNPATLFYRYWDLATQAWIDAAAAYTSGNAITPPVDRAYAVIAVLRGTLTAAQAAGVVGVP